MKEKIKIYFFHNGSGGGVLSVIKNLVKFLNKEKFDSHIIYTINRDVIKSYSLPGIAATEQLFLYSSRWNFYHTCKKLAGLIADKNAIIVANDWLELGMVSHIGLTNPVLQILHGDYEYYYRLSQKHQPVIDAFVTVAAVMSNNLCKRLPERNNDIYYLPFPVPDILPKKFFNYERPLQIIFIGRRSKEKGYNLLPVIAEDLRNKNIVTEWHIVGEEMKDEKVCWLPASIVTFYGQQPNENVITLMQQMDCLVLPSLAEGMPVTVVEAMKIGLTCLVNDIPGGIQELIINSKTGFKVEKNAIAGYVAVLQHLNNNRPLLESIATAARSKAQSMFHAVDNTNAYEQLFEKLFFSPRKPKSIKKVYGSRLDQDWIPNFITQIFRRFLLSQHNEGL